MKKLLVYKLLIVFVMTIIGIYAYPMLPDIVPVHWGFDGTPDRMGSKLMSLIMFPAISLLLVILFYYLPRFDPKKENYAKFGEIWEIFQFSILGFFTYIYFLSIFITLNPEYNMSKFVLFGLGALFLVLGNYMGKIRQNYFVGIKLPWTLANEEVWNKTHRFGGKMFMLAGILFMVNAFFLRQTLLISGLAIGAVLIAPIIYSYMIFKKIK